METVEHKNAKPFKISFQQEMTDAAAVPTETLIECKAPVISLTHQRSG